ncbi:MAG: DMT family transporter [Candidatus Nanopelagicales bacterium]
MAVGAFAGVLMALQSRANGELAHVLGNSKQASLISFGSGFLVLMVMAAVSPRLRGGLRQIRTAAVDGRLPRWQTLAGMSGAIYVLVQAYAVPIMGVAIFSVATIAGQSTSSIAVDRMGLRSGVRHHITARRIVTAVVTVAAVAVSVADRVQGAVGWLALVAFASGLLVSVQRALNAHITDYSEHSYATTWLNFATGVALLLVVNLVVQQPLGQLPTGPSAWWMYIGGTIGVVFIAISSVAVQKLGVLMFTVLSVGGQLVGALIIDILYPTPGVQLSMNMYAGIALSLIGVLIGIRPRRRPRA